MNARSRRGRGPGAWGQATRLAGVWITPALLLAVPTDLVAGGRDGLWTALLFVLAPLFGSLVVALGRPLGRVGAPATFASLSMLLVAGLVLWANLSLAGEVATWLSVPRWSGILAIVIALGALLWAPFRPWPWLVAVGLVALLLPVAAMLRQSEMDPIASWSQVASQTAFRFRADSPWVTEGRAVGREGRALVLSFEEEHRVTPVDPGELRVEVSDRGRLQVHEWTLAAGQSVTLRPGDRLRVDAPLRLKFEAGKRVPGAPVSGIAWADSSPVLRPLAPGHLLGLAITFLGGAVALLGFASPAARGRAGVGLGGLLLLVTLGWAECWAVYAAWWAPEFFLGGVAPVTLLELPSLALRGHAWGPWLVGLSLGGLAALFLAGAAALKEQFATEESGADRGLWIGLSALAAVAALWPLEPWWLLQSALGLGASTVAPLVLLGAAPDRRRGAAWAVGLGLLLFVGLTAVGRLGIPSGAATRAIFAYPALVAAPVALSVLWVAVRTARP